jgi:hypothetical protein
VDLDPEVLAHYGEGAEHDRQLGQVAGVPGGDREPAGGRGLLAVPVHWAPGIRDRLTDPGQRQLILDSLTALEHDPAMTAATAHLLAVARRP